MELTLKLAVDPKDITTAQQKGACVVKGQIHWFTKTAVRASNERIRRALLAAVEAASLPLKTIGSFKGDRVVYHWTPNPEEPVAVTVDYCFAYPKGTPKRVLAEGARWHLKRPDGDNLTKSLLDMMTETGLLNDDSQVCDLRIRKLVTTGTPFVRVNIRRSSRVDPAAEIARSIGAIDEPDAELPLN